MINSRINGGLKKIKWASNDLLFSMRLKSLNLDVDDKRIIVYHGVTANAKTDINARFISTDLFEKQIQYFTTHFHVVSLSNYFDGAYHPYKPTIAITFDDGYQNNLTEALPILEKYKAPATFFITTVQQANYSILWADALDLFRYTNIKNEFVFNNMVYKSPKNEYKNGRKTLKKNLKRTGWNEKKSLVDLILSDNDFIDDQSLKPYYQLLSDEEILQLSKSRYAEIGSHGLYHNCLTKIPLEKAKEELTISKSYLENIIQKEVISFAYPDGDYNNELISAAEKVGYKNQLVVDYIESNHLQDSRLENRFGINPYISFNNQIQCLLDGEY